MKEEVIFILSLLYYKDECHTIHLNHRDSLLHIFNKCYSQTTIKPYLISFIRIR